MQAEFRCNWTDHVVHTLNGVAFYLDCSTVLLCCQDLSNLTYTRLPDNQDIALNKIQSWLDCIATYEKSSSGVVILEKTEDFFAVTYISKHILNCLGFDHDTYMEYISNNYSAQYLLDQIAVTKCSLDQVVASKEWNLSVKCQSKTGEVTTQDVTLSVSPRTVDDRCFYEILINHTPKPQEKSHLSKDRIFARTFGRFDLFVDNIPVVFTNKKEKEFLALLIDLNGGTLTTDDAISFLWEDAQLNDRLLRRYRKLCTTLKNTLVKYGIEHIMINNHGIRSIDVSTITCDYYEYLAGNPKYKDSFHNAYMSDYEWAENTLASMWDYDHA
jgi:hypothetical protein